MKDKIVLNSAEQRRLLVLNQLEAGVVSAAQAAQVLGRWEPREAAMGALLGRPGPCLGTR